jgi:secreted trypsin-like serine protease
MTRQRSFAKLLPALMLALGSCVPAAAAQPAQRQIARAAIIGGQPAVNLTAQQAVAFASLAEVLDLRGNEIGQCTGTVVAPTLILTAGHCAEDIETGVINAASGYRILTGAAPGAPAGSEGQVSAVAGVIVDERFRRRVDAGDAALLVLAAPIAAPPIKLATDPSASALQPGTPAMIAGWGKTSYAQQVPTEGLRWVDTAVQAPRWCRRHAPPFFARSEICTIDPPTYSTGACNGDSGGPLLAAEGPEGALVQVGITVHGYEQCSTHMPTVYTRLAAIAPWVQSWIDAYRSTSGVPAQPAP